MSIEGRFPAAVDDAVAVYRELLKSYKPSNIGIYGTSAGAILTAEVVAKLKQLGLPMPAALGIFSGMGDFARPGDSAAMYALRGIGVGLWFLSPGRVLMSFLIVFAVLFPPVVCALGVGLGVGDTWLNWRARAKPKT